MIQSNQRTKSSSLRHIATGVESCTFARCYHNWAQAFPPVQVSFCFTQLGHPTGGCGIFRQSVSPMMRPLTVQKLTIACNKSTKCILWSFFQYRDYAGYQIVWRESLQLTSINNIASAQLLLYMTVICMMWCVPTVSLGIMFKLVWGPGAKCCVCRPIGI